MVSVMQAQGSIVFSNKHVEISISDQNAQVESILDRQTGQDLKGEDACFFALQTGGFKENTEVVPTGLRLTDSVITVQTELGEFEVEVRALENYFTFELISKLPAGAYKTLLAQAKYKYDYKDKKNTGAIGIPMTYWADPVFYADAKACETRAEVIGHLRDKGAKYALIIAPINEHRDIIKEVSLTIDRNVGIMSTVGGAWGRDSRLTFGNYTIQHETSPEFIQENMGFFKELGVDQIDFHQGYDTFRQGDFKFKKYESAAEFKRNVSNVLGQIGIGSGLHTYSFYIRKDCDVLLGDPKYQKDLSVLHTFTLADDVAADEQYIPSVEPTDMISADCGFHSRNSDLILVGEEVIYFTPDTHGFKVSKRGAAGTKAVAHQKGEVIKHLDAYYYGIAPVMGSELFLEIARRTGVAFNEGGFDMIYLDALDGVRIHSGEGEIWYYSSMFVCEVLKACQKDPVIEYSMLLPAIWPARGRVNAFDTTNRGYKSFLKRHALSNLDLIDRYSAPTLGWYNYYPELDCYPGNEHHKYQHTDAVDYMGTLAVAFDFSTVFEGTSTQDNLRRMAGLRRNLALYKKYDDLRKTEYFSEEYRAQLAEGLLAGMEYKLQEALEGNYYFVEKKYQTVKLYDLNDAARNGATFQNPFGRQVPFVRIEALLSAKDEKPMVLLALDEKRELTEQKLNCQYEDILDLSDQLAKKVRIHGNGKKGSAVCISFKCTSESSGGYGRGGYIIETDFIGWREFILLETDNGERTEFAFEEGENAFPVYRTPMDHDRIFAVEVKTQGDMTDVRMSSIVACKHTYEVLKNPTLKVGETALMFECELMSSDFIEFDGKRAKVIDRYGNEKPIWFTGDISVPEGKFQAVLTARALNGGVPRAKMTIGFEGNIVSPK